MKYKGLYGQYIKDPVAYCRLHRVSLSTGQIKGKQCIDKSCRYFSKYKNHRYWKGK